MLVGENTNKGSLKGKRLEARGKKQEKGSSPNPPDK
jgi:hypothetical protein